MKSMGIRGMQLAVARMPTGKTLTSKVPRLVIARKYTWADDDYQDKYRTKHTTPMRIGSVSKVLTATAALKLWQDGKLNLDVDPDGNVSTATNVKDTLKLEKLDGSTLVDQDVPWYGVINLQHLLSHTGGWKDGPVDDVEGFNEWDTWNKLLTVDP